MPKIYFHITDQDLIKKMRRKRNLITKPKEAKPKTHEPKYCPICKAENGKENVFCWKCGNSFENVDILKEVFIQPDKFRELETKNRELTDTIKSMSKMMLNLDQSFREALNENYEENEESIIYSEEEMREFREKVKSLLKKE